MTSTQPGLARRIGRAFGRALAGAFVATALLAAAAALYLHRAMRPERLRPLVISQLERTFQRRVDIRSVSVALHQGVRATGIKVHARPGAPEEFFLSADVMLVKYSLPALLERRLVLTKARLVNPRVSLYRRPDGTWNIEEMLLATRGAGEGRDLHLPPLSSAEEFRLEDGTVRLVDEAAGLDTTFRDVFLSVDDFSLDNPFSLRAKLQSEGTFLGRSHTMRLEGDLQVLLAAFADERTALSVTRLKGVVDGRPFEASGQLRNLALPDFDLRLGLPALSSEDLADLSGKDVAAGISLPPTTWGLRVRTAPVSESSPTPAAYVVESLSVSGGPWKLEAAGRLTPEGALSGTLKTRGAPLAKAAELFAPWGEAALSGTLDATLSLGGTAGSAKVTQWALDLRGFAVQFWNGKRFSETDMTIRAGEGFKSLSVKVGRGTYVAYSNALSELEAEARLSGGDLAVPRLALTWNGSRINLKGCVRELKTWSRVAVDAEVDRLRVDETYAAVENLIAQRAAELGRKIDKDRPWAQSLRFAVPDRFPDMTGRLRVAEVHSPNFRAQNLDLVWDLQGIARELKTVTGHFQMGFGPGSLKNITEMQKAHPLVNVLLIPYVELHKIRQRSRLSPETAVPTGLDFTRAFGDFGAGSGTVGVNFIHFDSPPFQAYTAGTADFPAERVDLNVLMRMTEPAQNLPFYMVDTQGRMALDVSLVKDLNKPEVVFRGKKVAADAIEKGLEEGLKRVRPMPEISEAAACGRSG